MKRNQNISLQIVYVMCSLVYSKQDDTSLYFQVFGLEGWSSGALNFKKDTFPWLYGPQEWI